MTRTVIIMAAGCAALGFAATGSALAQKAGDRLDGARAARAQAQPSPPRARTRIRVTPAYPYRTYSTTYPVPYRYEYPGPGFVRQCTAWLAPENRVSGTVIVPRMRCWWQPG